jgi:hypothetical protein
MFQHSINQGVLQGSSFGLINIKIEHNLLISIKDNFIFR